MRILYDFWCDNHGKFESIVDSSETESVLCLECNSVSKKCPSFRGSIGVFHEYYSVALNQHFTGAKQVRDKCKEMGITALRPGDKIDYAKNRREKKAEADRKSYESAEKFIDGPINALYSGEVRNIRQVIEKDRRLENAEKGITPRIVVSSS